MYINGIGAISPQSTFTASELPATPVLASGDRLNVIEPDYTGWIDVRAIRRMSRVIRMGFASALSALKEANVTVPDAIITGTAYGCLDDTGIFLTKMIEQNEEALNPTPFIQSTHNTIGSQIALFLKAYGYNQTYVHRAFSYENSLLDTKMLLMENPEYHVLTGGVDEMTTISYNLLRRFGLTRNGVVLGEGASFQVFSAELKPTSFAQVVNVATCYRPSSEAELTEWVEAFLNDNNLVPGDIDLVLNGDVKSNPVLSSLRSINYKALCGEYPTATSFAVWLAATTLRSGKLSLSLDGEESHDSVKTILIYNAYFGTHYSLILLKSCPGSES